MSEDIVHKRLTRANGSGSRDACHKAKKHEMNSPFWFKVNCPLCLKKKPPIRVSPPRRWAVR